MRFISMRFFLIIFCVLLTSCSTSNSRRATDDFEAIRKFEPYSLKIAVNSPQVEVILREYMIMELGRYLQIEESGKGKIEVFYTSHDQRNEYSTWQNSTMLMIIKDSMGQRLWTGEYNYKGGMEMSGFSVNSPLEAAKLTTKRIVNKLVSDYSL
jgi:hypothetical protein